MTVRPIRQFGDPVLRQVCHPVIRFDDTLVRLVTDLMDTCRIPGRAGLAAPQIGVTLRVFSYNVDGLEGYVINPVVVHTEGEQHGPEGCLSVHAPQEPTPRAWRAVVTGVDLDKHPIEVDGSELLGRCLQHETDHLNGRLYLDLLDPESRRRTMSILRNNQIDNDL
jgi:peptide deformylase